MERIVKIFLLFHLSIFSKVEVLVAQQTPLYAQYYLNPYLYNPAMAGAKAEPGAYFLYRKQWAGIDGAPETQVFTLDGKLDKHPVGLGLTFFNDVTNIIGRTGGALTGAYQVQLASEHTLRFGLSLSASRNRIFFDRINAEDLSDPNLLNVVDQKTAFESNAGLVYNYQNLHIAFAAEQLFQNSLLYRNEALFRTLNYTLVRHYYTSLYYILKVAPELELQPMLMIRTVQGLRSQLDFNTVLNWKKTVWANVNYRHGIGAGFSLGWALDKQFVFGYAYEFPTTDLNILGNATHEFVLGLRLNRGTNSPVSRKNSTAQAGLSAADYEKMDALSQQNELLGERQEKLEAKLDEQNEELRLLREIVSGYEQELAEAIGKLQANPEQTPGEKGPYYLVVGALRTLENAKLLQRIIKREAGIDTRVVQSASGTWYFVYTREFNSVAEGTGQVEELLKSPARPYIIGNPWIYKSEKK